MFFGNLDARRDRDHARDYVEGMWQILEQDELDDYVLATEKEYSVCEFVECAFQSIDVGIECCGTGESEMGVDAAIGTVRVLVEPRYYRFVKVDHLLGDSGKARKALGWQPSISFVALVVEIVTADQPPWSIM
jgi:GDPmannose 4,6-dehydratase